MAARLRPDSTPANTGAGPEASVRNPSQISRIRKIAAIPIWFALVYGLLMASWSIWGEAYAGLYASAVAFLFESSNPERGVFVAHLAPQPGTPAETWSQDTVVSLRIGGARVGFQKVPTFARARSSLYTGYVPTALSIALVLAAPISWRRRARALPWAVLLASAFSVLMVALWIHGWFYAQECIWLASVSAKYASRAELAASFVNLSTSLGPYYIAPVFIAVLVSLRRRDLDSVLESLPGTSESRTSDDPGVAQRSRASSRTRAGS